jgi:hypothetical protein
MSWVGGVQLEGVEIVYLLMGIHIRKTLRLGVRKD